MNDNKFDEIIFDLKKQNKKFCDNRKNDLKKHVSGQNPRITVLTCSDSRVVPEYIFNKDIGEIFVVRIAGNIAMDDSVITSLEYAVDHLKTSVLIILGHTNCGAIAASEDISNKGVLFDEIRNSFKDDKNHVLDNLNYQLEMLPKRSKIISDKINNKELNLIGAIYNLSDGKVEFL